MKYDIKSSKYIGIEPEPVNKNFLAMDRTMQEGYGHDMNGDIVKAAQCWKSVFEDLKMYMEEHQLTDLKSFDDIFNGTQYVGNWVQDYDDTLRNVLVEADKSSRKEVGRQKIELLEFLIGLNIPDELSLHNHKRSLAETYYMLGQPEVGERHYLDLMEAYPDNVWGYVGYADEYWLNESGIRDYDKAYRLLDVAYNRLTIEDSDIIVERLTDLTLNMKKKELAEFLDSGKASEGSGERPIVPEYRDLYQKLFRLREDRRGISPVKTRANPTHYEQPLVKGKKIGRNAPCPCGSGKKYKKCCGK